MGRPKRVTCAAAMAVATLAILAACGGGDDSGAGHAGDPTALPRHQASGRPSDQASDPYLNQENPRRFIQRWASAEARMKNTGKIAPYVALSRECVSCRQLAHTVARYFAAGGFIHGGAWRIDSIKISPSSQGMLTYVVRSHAAPMTVRESSSRPVEHVSARPVSHLIGMMGNGASFTVASRTLGQSS